MNRLLRWLPLALSVLVHPVGATDFETLYKGGVEARLSGNHTKAADQLARALALSPEDPDALVQMGYTRLALGDATGASKSFAHALEEAPDYVDAQRGLAQSYLRAGSFDEAIQIYQQRPERSREGSDWLGLGDAYRLAGRELSARSAYKTAHVDPSTAVDAQQRLEDPDFFPFRMDVTVSGSELDHSPDAWREVAMRFGVKVSAETAVSVGSEWSRRYGSSDLYLDFRIDHDVTEELSTYVVLGGAGQGDFRPDASMEFGISTKIAGGHDTSTTAHGIFALRRDLYGDESITTIKTGVDQSWADGDLLMSARLIKVLSNQDRTSTGWAAQGRLQLTNNLGLYAGYSDVPDTDSGRVSETMTSFAGISFDYASASRLELTYAVEERGAGVDRKTLAVSHSFRF